MAERAEPTLYNRREVDPRQAQVQRAGGPAKLADILESGLDKGIVIAGDIQINLLDIELLTIKLRLLIASVERAQEMGINWWQSDPTLSSSAKELEEENQELRERLERLGRAAGLRAPRGGAAGGCGEGRGSSRSAGGGGGHSRGAPARGGRGRRWGGTRGEGGRNPP